MSEGFRGWLERGKCWCGNELDVDKTTGIYTTFCKICQPNGYLKNDIADLRKKYKCFSKYKDEIRKDIFRLVELGRVSKVVNFFGCGGFEDTIYKKLSKYKTKWVMCSNEPVAGYLMGKYMFYKNFTGFIGTFRKLCIALKGEKRVDLIWMDIQESLENLIAFLGEVPKKLEWYYFITGQCLATDPLFSKPSRKMEDKIFKQILLLYEAGFWVSLVSGRVYRSKNGTYFLSLGIFCSKKRRKLELASGVKEWRQDSVERFRVPGEMIDPFIKVFTDAVRLFPKLSKGCGENLV